MSESLRSLRSRAVLAYMAPRCAPCNLEVRSFNPAEPTDRACGRAIRYAPYAPWLRLTEFGDIDLPFSSATSLQIAEMLTHFF